MSENGADCDVVIERSECCPVTVENQTFTTGCQHLQNNVLIRPDPDIGSRRELAEPSVAGRPADARKMKSAGRRGPSVSLVILELTEPAGHCPPDATIFRTYTAGGHPADFII